MVTRHLVTAAALLTGVLTALASAMPAAAAAAPDSMQQRVDAALAATPGGTQTAWNEVSWDGGAMVLTLAPEGTELAAKVSSCASGKFCVYSALGYGGSQLTFSTCTSGLSVAPLGKPVRSIANSRTSGTVTAHNGSTVVLTVAPGTGKNTTKTITSLSCA